MSFPNFQSVLYSVWKLCKQLQNPYPQQTRGLWDDNIFPPIRPQHKNSMIINGAPCPNIREVNERSIDAGVALLTSSDSLKRKFRNKIRDFKTWFIANSGRTWHFRDFLHFQQEIMDKCIQIHQLLHGNWFSIVLRIAGSPPTGFLGCSPRHQWSSGILGGMYNSDAQHFGGPRRNKKKQSC